MHFTTDELRLIAASLASTNSAGTVTLRARIHLAIAKQEVAALTKAPAKPVKPAKEVK